jgi:ABC-type bacteriocin/lantibiotic exporter with double-glycine peptidase domain
LDREVEITTLSSGQLQKLAFTRALLNKPKVLLLDEAMANLDEKSKELVLSIMKDMKITVINSTHDPERFENIDAIIKLESINEKRIVKKIRPT